MYKKNTDSKYFFFPGKATNVSVQLLVASMGSINTENMVRELPQTTSDFKAEGVKQNSTFYM